MKKAKKIFEIGTKSYSLALGRLLALRKELSEQTHAQLSALVMKKIVDKIQELGFESLSKKMAGKLGKPIDGLYNDITEEKKAYFIESITTYWEKGYNQNEAAKTATKVRKRQETLARIAEANKKSREQNQEKT